MSATKLSKDIIVITDHSPLDNGDFQLTNPAKQVLTLARNLTSGEVLAVALNSVPDTDGLGRFGATKVLVPNLAGNSPRVPGVVADAVAACIATHPVAAVLCVSNYRGREVAAQLSMQLNSSSAVDVTSVSVGADAALVATKSVFSGAWQTTFSANRGIPVIAIRSAAIEANEVAGYTVPVCEEVAVTYSAQNTAVRVRSSKYLNNCEKVNLADAQVVVCGGRGTDGDFTLVERLADALGGAVGATRVCVDEGWVDRSLQIGQTGVTIAPKIYIGLGVSGAIHHTCGMQLSDKIIAVCDDSDAPIFGLADIGIVGDINEIIPRVLEQL